MKGRPGPAVSTDAFPPHGQNDRPVLLGSADPAQACGALRDRRGLAQLCSEKEGVGCGVLPPMGQVTAVESPHGGASGTQVAALTLAEGTLGGPPRASAPPVQAGAVPALWGAGKLLCHKGLQGGGSLNISLGGLSTAWKEAAGPLPLAAAPTRPHDT